jgi:hypothetical protein
MDEHELSRLIADSHQNLARFLKIEAQSGLLYMRLAETEASLKDEEAARRAKDFARRAYGLSPAATAPKPAPATPHSAWPESAHCVH